MPKFFPLPLLALTACILSTSTGSLASTTDNAAATRQSRITVELDASQQAAAARTAADASPASLCNDGSEQSPINIDTVYPYRLDYQRNPAQPSRIDPPRLRFVMFPTALALTREADGVRARITSGSYTRVNRERYELSDIRFRTPAEHLVNGHRYPVEIQLLHRHNNALAIFSVFVEEGNTVNPVLS